MLSNRIKQFREYNKISCEILAKLLGITESEYANLESGTASPSIFQIERLAFFYNVTVDEFYGFSPRLTLNTQQEIPLTDDDEVDQKILKLSDLSWDEVQVLLHYRNSDNKDEIIKNIINNKDYDKK